MKFEWYPGEPETTLFRIVGPEVLKRGRAVQFAARGMFGHETGRLSASVDVKMSTRPNKIIATIGSDVPYAIYNEKGVGLWGSGKPICAKNAPYLVFWIGGRKIVTKCVRGYPGTHALMNALKHAQDWPVVELDE